MEIDIIISEIKNTLPNIYTSIEPIINEIINPDNIKHIFQLLHGKVQSGKSLAISILIWIMKYKYNFYPVFLTKNLSTIRNDIINKLKYGKLSEILTKLNLTQYLPNIIEYHDIKSHKSNKSNITYIPIFIMNHNNYKEIIKYNSNLKTHNPTAEIIYIIDEIHEWYTNQTNFIESHGLKITKIPSAFHMLHWIHNNSKFSIGITATPYRVLADQVLRPLSQYVHELIVDPPVAGYKYIGFNNTELSQNSFNINYYNSDEISYVDIILKIIKKSYINKQNTFLLVTVEKRNIKQDHIFNLITKFSIENKYDVYCRTFHQDLKLQNNSNSLDDFFSNIPDECSCIILIGYDKLDTGVSIKPFLTTSKFCGITDQIIDNINSLESGMQINRFFGWYPENHTATIHLPAKYVNIYESDMNLIHREFIDKYDGTLESIEEIENFNVNIKQIFGNKYSDLFKSSSDNRKIYGTLSFSNKINRDTKTSLLDTTIIKFNQINEFNKINEFKNMSICDFYNKIKLQNELRKCLSELINIKLTFFQIPYSQARFNSILLACANPHGNSWKVNSFLYGDDGIKTLIKDAFIVLFNEEWSKRLVVNDIDIFRLTFKYRTDEYCTVTSSLYSSSIVKHKYVDDVNNFKLSDEHHNSLKKISKYTNSEINAWELFRKTRIYMNLPDGGKAKTCAKYWKIPSINNKFKELIKNKDDNDNIDDLIKKGCTVLE